jgi:hypothetical protein
VITIVIYSSLAHRCFFLYERPYKHGFVTNVAKPSICSSMTPYGSR